MLTKLLPPLIEQIFHKYERQFEELRNSSSAVSSNPHKHLFIELNAVFGEVLANALRLLDEQTITVITAKTTCWDRQIVEIVGRGAGKRIVRLFPGINYCGCDYFTRCVLNLDVASASTATSPVTSHSSARNYTCEHVLALRLAVLLRSSALHTESLHKHKFKLMINEIHLAP